MLDKIYTRIVNKAVENDIAQLDLVQMSDMERSLLYELMHTRVKLEFRTWISRISFTLAAGSFLWIYTHI